MQNTNADGNMLSKLELEKNELQINIHHVENESVDSTRRMITNLAESTNIGISTLDALHIQGSQLDNIVKGLRDVQENTKEAERTVKRINACCWGLCFCSFRKKTNRKYLSDLSIITMSKVGETKEEQQFSKNSTENLNSSDNFIAKFTNSKKETEMDNNLKEVSSMVGNLQNLALDMHNEISRQNPLIDHLINETEDSKYYLKTVEEKCNEIIK